MEVRIGNSLVGDDHPVFIVAEISGNHNGKLENAIRLIDAAKECGADAVKFQAFDPVTLAKTRNKPGLLDQYRAAHTPRLWFGELFAEATTLGIEAFATVYHKDDIDFMRQFSPVAYKVSSFEANKRTLYRALPKDATVLVSFGKTSTTKLTDLYSDTIMDDERRYVTMHCVSKYPATVGSMRLSAGIDRVTLPVTVPGLSTHCPLPEVAAFGVACGARVIEAHLRLGEGGAEEEPCAEDAFALNETEFEHMVKLCHLADEAL
jgi:N-acetylneuraminate synthase